MKKGWIFLLVLLCVAFLVSCGKKNDETGQAGELVYSQQSRITTGVPTNEKINSLSAGI